MHSRTSNFFYEHQIWFELFVDTRKKRFLGYVRRVSGHFLTIYFYYIIIVLKYLKSSKKLLLYNLFLKFIVFGRLIVISFRYCRYCWIKSPLFNEFEESHIDRVSDDGCTCKSHAVNCNEGRRNCE